MKIKSWLKNIGVSVVKNGCDHSRLRTLKLAVSQDGFNGINWFLVCLHKLRKARSFFNNFWVVVAKNGYALLGLGTLKSGVSHEWNGEIIWFFTCLYKFRKAESYFNNYWVDTVKNGRGLDLIYLTNNLINWTDWMIFASSLWSNSFWFHSQSTLYIWHLNAGRPLQIPFGQKQQNMVKNDPKIGFFAYIEKFYNWFLLEAYLNTIWYCYIFYCTNPYLGKFLFLSYDWKGF